MQETFHAVPLQTWANLSEVSQTVGLTHDTLYKLARRASRHSLPWVKCEPYPFPDSPKQWLVDTSHEQFRQHIQRLYRRAPSGHPLEGPDLSNTLLLTGDEDPFAEDEPQETEPMMRLSAPLLPPPEQPFDLTKAFPEFSHSLADRGLVVYVNAVSADQRWRWSWGDRARSGYADATAALLAAIQDHVTATVPVTFETPPRRRHEEAYDPFDEEPPPEPVEEEPELGPSAWQRLCGLWRRS